MDTIVLYVVETIYCEPIVSIWKGQILQIGCSLSLKKAKEIKEQYETKAQRKSKCWIKAYCIDKDATYFPKEAERDLNDEWEICENI